MNKAFYTAIFFIALTACTGKKGSGPVDIFSSDRYSWEELDKRTVPQWFDDAKFGIMIHWGPSSVLGLRRGNNYAEWAPRDMYSDGKDFFNNYLDEKYGAHPPDFGYKDFIPLFRAENWDPSAWADLFERAGARYVTMTAEHHDGYAMWDSELTEWCASKIGPGRDLVGDLGIELRKRGIRYAPSYHRERHPSFFAQEMYVVKSDPVPEIAEEIIKMPAATGLYGPFEYSDEFIRDYVARWKEIERKYKPDFMWLDDVPLFYWTEESKNHPQTQKFRNAFLNMIGDYFRAADEWGKDVYLNNKGRHKNWPDGPGCLEMDNMNVDSIAEKWENPATLGTSYGYARDEDTNNAYRSPEDLIHLLCDVVSKNGNLLLNIGPRADGTIPDGMKKRLLAIGEWLQVNGEAIYGTRPWRSFKQEDPDIRFTHKHGFLYAISLEKPSEPFYLNLNGDISPDEIKEVYILGMKEKVEWKPGDKRIKIFPPESIEGKHAWTFKIQL